MCVLMCACGCVRVDVCIGVNTTKLKTLKNFGFVYKSFEHLDIWSSKYFFVAASVSSVSCDKIVNWDCGFNR